MENQKEKVHNFTFNFSRFKIGGTVEHVGLSSEELAALSTILSDLPSRIAIESAPNKQCRCVDQSCVPRDVVESILKQFQ